jgi:hypothetical protein
MLRSTVENHADAYPAPYTPTGPLNRLGADRETPHSVVSVFVTRLWGLTNREGRRTGGAADPGGAAFRSRGTGRQGLDQAVAATRPRSMTGRHPAPLRPPGMARSGGPGW